MERYVNECLLFGKYLGFCTQRKPDYLLIINNLLKWVVGIFNGNHFYSTNHLTFSRQSKHTLMDLFIAFYLHVHVFVCILVLTNIVIKVYCSLNINIQNQLYNLFRYQPDILKNDFFFGLKSVFQSCK